MVRGLLNGCILPIVAKATYRKKNGEKNFALIRRLKRMKPRTQLYRILARCKSAKHGPSQKALRKRENEKVAQELGIKHSRATRDIDSAWREMCKDW